MNIEFEEEYLQDLYEKGSTKSKKHRYQDTVIKQYTKTVDKLKAARNIEDLYPLKSLNYEKLSGNKKELESVRVNDHFRIEFRTRIEGVEPHTITICSITALSNHYK